MFDDYEVEKFGSGQKLFWKLLKRRYVIFLQKCCEHYAKGQRCFYEDDEQKIFECLQCEHRYDIGYCNANYLLKRIVKLISELAADTSNLALTPLTKEEIDEFKSKDVDYMITTSICKPIWIVSEKPFGELLKFTPEELNSIFMMSQTLKSRILYNIKK